MATKKGKATRAKDPLAPEIGRRIQQAREGAGIPSLSELSQRAQVNLRLLNKYVTGETMPGVRALLRIADVCGVSLDWLVRGQEFTPPALLDWLETPVGKTVDEETRRFLRALPLHGYRPSVRFYDLALHAIREGLTPEETVQAARITEDRH